jgi:hypothetical protein
MSRAASRVSFLALACLLSALPARALPVGASTARQVARNAIREHIAAFGSWGGAATPRIAGVDAVDVGGDRLAYNVRVEPSGHVLVAADDEFNPVLLYSDTHSFDAAGATDPDSLEGWIVPEVGRVFERLKEWSRARPRGTRPAEWEGSGVSRAWRHLDVPDAEFRPLRKDFSRAPAAGAKIAGTEAGATGTEAGATGTEAGATGTEAGATNDGAGVASVVGPLLSTDWSQGSRYNDYTPAGSTCAHTVSGCVAIAAVQIMKYWSWPASGTGSHSYTWSGRTLSASFAHPYYWSLMPRTLSGASAAQIDAVARLVSDVGIAVEMNYGCGGSGAYTGWIASTVLPTYFNYKPSTGSVSRSGQTAAAFFTRVQAELDSSPRRPVLFSVRTLDGASGHALVIDGYQTGAADLVHLNLGWGASYQGWYNINADWSAGGYQWSATSQVIYTGIEPAAPRFTLSASKNGTGAGTVSSAPAGVNCGATCAASFAQGAAVQLTATAAAGSHFVAWSGDCNSAGSVTMASDAACAATFDLDVPTTATLTVTRPGNGAGLVTSAAPGIDCGSDCGEVYPRGALVTLTAAAAPGSLFVGWTGACAGRDTCSVAVAGDATVGAVFQSSPLFRRYFAEGAATAFFDCSFALVNPGGTTAHVTLHFLKDGVAANVDYLLDIPPLTRRTVDAKAVPGLYPSGGFSTIIESDAAVVADRTMSWDASGYGAHTETAVEAPAQTWYLAEGATLRLGGGGFDLYYPIENPNDRAVNIQVTYLRTYPNPPVVKTYTIDALRRRTIWVNGEDPGLVSTDVSGIVTSLDPSLPIIAERAMYLNSGGRTFGAGHAAAGVTEPSLDWFLAEGATGPTFDLYLVVANPNPTAAELDVTYLLPDGRALVKRYQAGANSRRSIWVNGETVDGVSLASTSLSARVHSVNGVRVIVERAMWWPGPGWWNWYEGHCSVGSTTTGTLWALAEGQQGGPRNAETFVLVANTSPFVGRVRMTLVFEDGSTALAEMDIPANSRTTVWTGGAQAGPGSPFGGLTQGKRFGTLVESLPVDNGPAAGVVVERALYWDAGGQWWAAGTNSGATKLR